MGCIQKSFKFPWRRGGGRVCPLCISYYFLNAVLFVPFAEKLRIHSTSMFMFWKTLSQRAASGFHYCGDKLSKPLWQMDQNYLALIHVKIEALEFEQSFLFIKRLQNLQLLFCRKNVRMNVCACVTLPFLTRLSQSRARC